jgi:phage terminase Nu1 subunit (DNA packaging protein)
MRKFVARLNIDHYRELLAAETDENKRKLIEQLLAVEEAELAAAKQKDQEQQVS